MKLYISLVNGLIVGALAAPTEKAIIHERRDTASHGKWIKQGIAPLPETRIPVRIALKQQNLDNGARLLMDVSDPASANYGKHYTAEQVTDMFAPDDHSSELVKNWLISSGIPERSITIPKSKGWITFDSTVTQMESILQTKYHIYDHLQSGQRHFGSDEYHLPNSVSNVIDFITPGVAPFMITEPVDGAKEQTARRRARVPLGFRSPINETVPCSDSATPKCIADYYGIPPATKAHPGNKMGLYQSYDQRWSKDDLDSFAKHYAMNIPQGTYPEVRGINGASNPGGPITGGTEAILDFEMAMPIVYPQGTVDYIVKDPANSGNGMFNLFLDAIDGSYCAYEGGDDPTIDGTPTSNLCGIFTPTNVLSISYGLEENDYPAKYLKRQCYEWMKLGLRGTSVFVSSGDDGAAGPGVACLGPNEDIFVVQAPASCPYVTTVGATEWTLQGNEVATSGYGSGGGFSNVFVMPDYQKSVVGAYLSNHNPGYPSYQTSDGNIPSTGGFYNSAGRGYPDIAALGTNGTLWVQGEIGSGYGTSMSTPIVAAMFNRINEERLDVGKSPVGFVNPALYAHYEMFNDITIGNQGDGHGCTTKHGFSTAPGWDPVTGMGTPKYPEMLKYFLSLP